MTSHSKTGTDAAPVTPQLPVLKGIRILSLALNLPGPAALMRLRAMGARCTKIEPPAPASMKGAGSGDPMGHYRPDAYRTLHEGIRTLVLDLKSEVGQKKFHQELAKTDVLLTSFRPSALKKLGIDWKTIHARYPALSQVSLVGSPGVLAEEPGHDLTYLASCGLINGMDLPATLYADMGGSLLASEAVLQALLRKQSSGRQQGRGVHIEVALSDAAAYLALPRTWGLTRPEGMVGGAHAGYRVYACRNGRVAVAALEPHFALRLCRAVGLPDQAAQSMTRPATHQAIEAFLAGQTRRQLDALAKRHDIPLHALP